MTAAEMRRHEDEAPERYREALERALPEVRAQVSYTDDRRALQVICTSARRRRLTWQFDAAELARARNAESYFVATMRICIGEPAASELPRRTPDGSRSA